MEGLLSTGPTPSSISNDCSVKILLHIPDTCTASSQYDIECVILCFRSVKTPNHTPGICKVSLQYEFAYAFSSHRCLEILLHTPGKSKAFSSLNVQMVVQVHFSESCFISLSLYGFLAALSSSRSIVVGLLVCWSGGVCEKVTCRVLNGN